MSNFTFSHNAFYAISILKSFNSQSFEKVTIGTTISHMIDFAVIIYYPCSLVIDIQCTFCKNAFNKRFKRIVCQNNFVKINSEKILTVCNAVYFRLCIDLMHITPPVTAEGFDDSDHPTNAECIKEVAIRTTFSHMINFAVIIYYTCNAQVSHKNAFNKCFLTNRVSK